MKKKSILTFKQDVEKKYGWNAIMGFWFGMIYLRYKNDTITYDDALGEMRKMSSYQGL